MLRSREVSVGEMDLRGRLDGAQEVRVAAHGAQYWRDVFSRAPGADLLVEFSEFSGRLVILYPLDPCHGSLLYRTMSLASLSPALVDRPESLPATAGRLRPRQGHSAPSPA